MRFLFYLQHNDNNKQKEDAKGMFSERLWRCCMMTRILCCVLGSFICEWVCTIARITWISNLASTDAYLSEVSILWKASHLVSILSGMDNIILSVFPLKIKILMLISMPTIIFSKIRLQRGHACKLNIRKQKMYWKLYK